MIEVEGRVLGGLDEFMLRVGHLIALCRVASEAGGSWARLHRETAQLFSTIVAVTGGENRDVAAYLAAKRLSPVEGQTPNADEDYAYPELRVVKDPEGHRVLRNVTGATTVSVSWQDRNLADRRIPSRVGAITWSAKSGSKTGLSHVGDWAQFLELVDSTGQLSPVGRLLAVLTETPGPLADWNPYIPHPAWLIVGYQYFQRDADLFARFAPLLLNETPPLSKATCRRLFVAALKSSMEDSEASTTINTRSRFDVFQQYRELERAARKGRTEIDETSTAWHRAASRMETYADLGLMEKERRSDDDKYKYVYYPTKRLERAVESLSRARTADEWAEQSLASVLLGGKDISDSEEDPSDHLAQIGSIVAALKLPTSQTPIDCLLLGLTVKRAQVGGDIPSLGKWRKMVEELPAKYPNVARLARGREGMRAEYVSIDLRKTAEV